MKLTKKRLKEIIREELTSGAFRPREEEYTGPTEEHSGTRRSKASMALEEMGEAPDSALIQLLRHVEFSDEDLGVLERLIDKLAAERARDFRLPLEDERLAALEAEL